MTSEIETNIVAVERINEYIHVENEVRRSQESPGTREKEKLLCQESTFTWSSHCGSAEMKPTSTHEDAGLIPGLDQWVKVLALP